MKKVYIENSTHTAGRSVESPRLYEKMFREAGWELSNTLEQADLLCLVGGADVTPALYGEANTSSGNEESNDIHSLGLISFAWKCDIPIVGVCRGAQILNVHMGGRMKQHIDGHGLYNGHTINFRGEEVVVTSTHHQEMIPNDLFCHNVYTAPDGVIEVVAYIGEKALCVQGHPEYHNATKEFREMFFKLIKEMMQ